MSPSEFGIMRAMERLASEIDMPHYSLVAQVVFSFCDVSRWSDSGFEGLRNRRVKNPVKIEKQLREGVIGLYAWETRESSLAIEKLQLLSHMFELCASDTVGKFVSYHPTRTKQGIPKKKTIKVYRSMLSHSLNPAEGARVLFAGVRAQR